MSIDRRMVELVVGHPVCGYFAASKGTFDPSILSWKDVHGLSSKK